MTSWTRIREVFEGAVELEPDARERFLEDQCGPDAELRSEVLRLLAADGSASPALERLADELLEDLGAQTGQSALIGRTIGAYRVQATLAAGGMGTVYEALQDKPERRVALKVMKRELIAGDGRRRFEYETRVLGRLRHPGIAQIYEAGSFRDELTGGEVPFFAMEFIEGARTIVDYAREEGLDLAAKLALFEKICSIVHHGHQQGVIHRDLKPRNILVDYLGRPKVIDFGIARAVEDDDEARQTRAGEVLGTVQYMSPEQMAGDPAAVSTRSDIYALGVVLYELLCGCSPFPLVNKNLAEAARIVAETEPVRPDRVRPELPKELVWVTLKALEKDPERRYTSAAELGEEIRRFLNNLPVLAVPPSVSYRFRKFLQRNRSEAMIGGLLLLVVTVGPVVTSVILARVNSSLQAANARYGRLADSLRLEELRARADELWPATPDRVEALRDWMRDAAPVKARLDTHRQTLATVERAAMLNGESTEIRWQYQVLHQLVEDLERFSDPDPTIGTFASVQHRLAWARTVVRRSIRDHEAGWEEARTAIAASPYYSGLLLEPQVGLAPLGENPQSGLWEFAHLESGDAPAPGASGTLNIGPESGLVFVLVPAGTFLMGAWPTSVGDGTLGSRDPYAAGDESPVTQVELDAFFLSKYETTQAQWERLAGTNPSFISSDILTESTPLTDTHTAALHPVERVTWTRARQVLQHHGLDLPTEAQWEYAARAGTTSVWWTGDDRESLRGMVNIADQAARRAGQDWSTIDDWPDLEDGYPYHCPVDAFLPNPYGFYNVLGNVYEWCLDGYADYSAEPRPGTGERRSGTPDSRTLRGGAFLVAASKARSADRASMHPDSFDIHVGVRAARALDTSGKDE